MSLVIFEDTELDLIEDSNNDFLISSKDVAKGYGCSNASIRNHLKNHNQELKEGKHWVKKDVLTKGGMQSITHWTKKGIVRLGFFIKSERAEKFRDWAEDYIVNEKSSNQPDLQKILDTLEKQNQEIQNLKNQLSSKEPKLPAKPKNPFAGYYENKNRPLGQRENEYLYSRNDWMMLLNECEMQLGLERGRKTKTLLISGGGR